MGARGAASIISAPDRRIDMHWLNTYRDGIRIRFSANQRQELVGCALGRFALILINLLLEKCTVIY
jgi:hypothetical protein